jgi:hypothetical protein
MANILGQLTLNQTSLLEVDDVPSNGAGTVAPIGSLAIYSDGILGRQYIKTGSANTSWNILTASIQDRRALTNLQSTTSNVHSPITEMVSGSLDTGFYRVLFLGKYQSTNTAAGIGFRLIAGTATVGYYALAWEIQQAANGTDQDFQYKQVDAAINITSASVVAANTDYLWQGRGIIEITAAGTVQAQFRSETNGTGVSVRANSLMLLEKI